MLEDPDAPSRPPSFEDGQDIRDRSLRFACDVVGFCERLDEGTRIARLMVPQLLNCTLSFATMLEEARSRERQRLRFEMFDWVEGVP